MESAVRLPQENVIAIHRRIVLDDLFSALLAAIPDPAMVVTAERQIVAVNGALQELLGVESEELVGLRPGEALSCFFSPGGEGGCGTGSNCAECGSFAAIVQCLETRVKTSRNCRFVPRGSDMAPMEVEVSVTPVTAAGVPLGVIVLRDLSAEVRKRLLERIFFHDVLNTVSGIRGVATALSSSSGSGRDKELRQWMVVLSERLVDEIVYHRNLMDAERGSFVPQLGVVMVPGLLKEVHNLYSNHPLASDADFVLGEFPEGNVITDHTILRRILGNFVVNALEAPPRHKTVTLRAEADENAVTFSVANPGVIPRSARLQIFQRSFSTKGSHGRGIGTYSAKLFGERYLKGEVFFESSEELGTVFSIRIFRNSFCGS